MMRAVSSDWVRQRWAVLEGLSIVAVLAAPSLAYGATTFETIADTLSPVDGRTFSELGTPDLSLRDGERALFRGTVGQGQQREEGVWLLKDGRISLVIKDKASLGDEGLLVHL